LRRGVLLAFVALAIVSSCAPDFDPPSKVAGLRILAAIGRLQGAGVRPRRLQILWVAGCVDPQGDQYFLCFRQLIDLLGPVVQGGKLPPSDLAILTTASPEKDGDAGAHTFSFTVPDDIVSRRPAPDEGPHYGIEYIFFAACAGRLAPAPFAIYGSKVPEFPVRCLDAQGNPQGPESFVPGYTQIYSFADHRRNLSPPIESLMLDGKPLPSEASMAPVVPTCGVGEKERRQRGCAGPSIGDSCTEHNLNAVVPDAAEVLEGADEKGGRLREVVWVSYFADRGDVSTSIKLVSDARRGYQPEHDTIWVAPEKPGLISIWAVVRDQRGGQSVKRGFVRVQ
jgi:hypothetical protein